MKVLDRLSMLGTNFLEVTKFGNGFGHAYLITLFQKIILLWNSSGGITGLEQIEPCVLGFQ